MRDLKNDLETIRATTKEKWYMKATDDKDFMCAIYITTIPGEYEHDQRRGMAAGEDEQVDPGKVIAITLLQSPPLAISEDDKWEENARFIVEAHNGGWEEAVNRALAAEALAQELEVAIRKQCEVCISPDPPAVISVCPYKTCSLWPYRNGGQKVKDEEGR
ncbi:MAG: hypothetical protein HPY71_01520 [Firmicutes bacterium]|nr:hypothetical protein [Bacillota bacterium]